MSHAAEKVLHQTVEHLRHNVTQLENQVRLLGLENEDLLQQLKDAGLQARHPVLQSDRLPPVLTIPDPATIVEAAARLTRSERRTSDAGKWRGWGSCRRRCYTKTVRAWT